MLPALLAGAVPGLARAPDAAATLDPTAQQRVCYESHTDGKLCVPAGEHLVMIGDSTMRYSYTTLAYALRHGVEFNLRTGNGTNSPGRPDVGDERSFWRPGVDYSAMGGGSPEFAAYFAGVSRLVGDECDCFRAMCCDKIIENHYFGHNGVRLTSLHLAGRRTMKGYWLPGEDTMQRLANGTLFPVRRPRLSYVPRWAYSATDAIAEVVAQLKPTVVVFNQGYHLDTDTLRPGEWAALQSAVQTHLPAARFLWRTTHFSGAEWSVATTPDGLARPKITRPRIEAEYASASKFFEVFPAHKLTLSIPAMDWWDSNRSQPHLRAPGNNRVNAALLQQLYPYLNVHAEFHCACSEDDPLVCSKWCAARDRVVTPQQSLPTPAEGTYANPVIRGDNPDPGAIFVDGSFYVVTTGDGFPIHRSVEGLDKWEAVGSVFDDDSRPDWAKEDFWAPEIHAVGKGFVVYYTARDFNGTLSIGAATSASVLGPYKDIGGPLARDSRAARRVPGHAEYVEYPGMYLDSHYFYDDASATHHLLWKHGSVTPPAETETWLYLQQLDDTGTRLVGERRVVLRNNLSSWEDGVVEAPWMVRPPGSPFYYLFYSGAHCCDGSGSYAVGVARATKLTGPYEKYDANPILRSNEGARGFAGPGHCSVVPSPVDAEQWLVFYHALVRPHTGGDDARALMMDVLSFDRATGWPRLATNTSSPSMGRSPLPPIQR